GRSTLPRRCGLHGVVGELERDHAARRTRPPARPRDRPLLLRLQRNGSARRDLDRLALRRRRHRALLRSLGTDRHRRGIRDGAQPWLDAAGGHASPRRPAAARLTKNSTVRLAALETAVRRLVVLA